MICVGQALGDFLQKPLVTVRIVLRVPRSPDRLVEGLLDSCVGEDIPRGTITGEEHR